MIERITLEARLMAKARRWASRRPSFELEGTGRRRYSLVGLLRGRA